MLKINSIKKNYYMILRQYFSNISVKSGLVRKSPHKRHRIRRQKRRRFKRIFSNYSRPTFSKKRWFFFPKIFKLNLKLRKRVGKYFYDLFKNAFLNKKPIMQDSHSGLVRSVFFASRVPVRRFALAVGLL